MLLNEGLETIDESCFEESGLERVSIPGSVKFVHGLAFARSSLRQVRFLGATENGQSCEHSSGNMLDGGSDNEQRLVIGEEAFSECEDLRQVVFEPGSAVDEIQYKAF